jgi:NAD(P)-dependent dehydrogenase (short-subunit alcohol dehydrogenase family)
MDRTTRTQANHDMANKDLMIISGGSRGIGHVLVQSCLGDMDVLNISRHATTVIGLSSRHSLHNLELDLQNVSGIECSLNAWFERNPGYQVKIFISNAAILNLGWLDKISPAEFNQAFQVNVQAPLTIANALFKGGRFCSAGARIAYVISSLARHEPGLSFAGAGLYSMTKAALSRMALVQSREFELRAPHIKVLRVHPGIVDTDMQQELRHDLELDPAFSVKTAGLPRYQEGDWDGRSPQKNMRTISAAFAAEFIWWAIRAPEVSSEEYDFYGTERFHAERASGPELVRHPIEELSPP